MNRLFIIRFDVTVSEINLHAHIPGIVSRFGYRHFFSLPLQTSGATESVIGAIFGLKKSCKQMAFDQSYF